MLSVFFVGLLFGVLAILSAEVALFLFVLKCLNRKIKQESLAALDLQSEPSLNFAYNKKGTVWVLESEKIPSFKDQKRKKDLILEVTPSRKHAKIHENSLVFTHSDSSRTAIPLKGCIIEAVSAKVRLFWRKLSRKALKPGVENKGNWTPAREDMKHGMKG